MSGLPLSCLGSAGNAAAERAAVFVAAETNGAELGSTEGPLLLALAIAAVAITGLALILTARVSAGNQRRLGDLEKRIVGRGDDHV